ncbi:sulfite exporter TauE/SafE family protein, partial [Bacillus halotolerans]
MQHLAAGSAAVGAGLINAVAGGGTLVSFPVLTALGVPAIRANATNTVALCPGYIGGTLAQRKDLAGLQRSLRPQLVAAMLGGLSGSILLTVSSEAVFRQIVPFLILAACLLLATQDRIRRWLSARSSEGSGTHAVAELVSVTAASVY